jgi:hypothetical protein
MNIPGNFLRDNRFMDPRANDRMTGELTPSGQRLAIAARSLYEYLNTPPDPDPAIASEGLRSRLEDLRVALLPFGEVVSVKEWVKEQVAGMDMHATSEYPPKTLKEASLHELEQANELPIKQCRRAIKVGLTDLEYLCVLADQHDGPHLISISSDFNLLRAKDDITGAFGHCGNCR